MNATGPTVRIVTGPGAGATTNGNVTFGYTASTAGSTFECALDQAALAACGAEKVFTNLTEGPHSFAVRATDPQNNVGGATTVTWTVDRSPPQITISAPAEGATTPSSTSIVFSADEPATFTCQIDAAAAAPCTSPLPLSGLAGGTHRFTLTAADGVGNTVTAPVRTFTVNDPPTLAALADQTTAEDTPVGPIALTVGDGQTTPGSLQVTAASDNATLLPRAGITVAGTGANRTLTLAPAQDASGTATVTVTVSDGTLAATRTFRLTVTPVNDAPVLAPVGNQSTLEGKPITFNVSVSDVDTPVADLRLSGTSSNPAILPDTGIVTGGAGATRTVTLSPLAQQSGTVMVTLVLTDGAASARQTITFTVGSVNDPPTIGAIADQTTPEDVPTAAIAFTVADIDTPAANLQVIASSSSLGVVAASGIALGGSGGARTVTLTPVHDATGVTTITLTVTDGLSSATTTFTLTVTAVNDAPVIDAVAAQATNEDTPITVNVGVSDVDSPATDLVLSATSSDQTLLPNGNIVAGGSGATRTLTLAPALNQNGTVTVTLTLRDGGGAGATTTGSFVLTVRPVNDAPAIAPVATQTTNEDTPLTINVGVSDPDSAVTSLQLSGRSSNQTLLPDGSITTTGTGATRALTLAPALNQSGSATVTLTLTDGTATTTATFTLNVTPVNDPPAIAAIAAQTMDEDGVLVVNVAVSDVDTPVGSLTLTGASSNLTLLPAVAVAGTGATRTVTLAPALNQSGSATVTLTLTDGAGGTATTSFALTVRPVNDAPAIAAVGPQTTNQDTPLTINVGVSDVDTPVASLVLTGASSNLTLFPAGSITATGTGATRALTLAPAFNQSGSATVTLTLVDGAGGTTTATFTMTVIDVNPALPAITASNPATTAAAPVRQQRPSLGIRADGTQTVLRVFRGSCNGAAVQEFASTAASATVTLGAAVEASADGTTVYFVESVDAGGHHSGCGPGFNYFTDNTRPTVTITGGPDVALGVTYPVTFAASDAHAVTLACSLDASPFADCDGATDLGGRALGRHVFTVTATDVSGNSASADHVFLQREGDGHVVLMGFDCSDCTAAGAPTAGGVAYKAIPLGNAVDIANAGQDAVFVAVLTDFGSDVQAIKDAINFRVNRNVVFTDFTTGSNLAEIGRTNQVIVLPAPARAAAGAMVSLGNAAAPALVKFVQTGGVVVTMDRAPLTEQNRALLATAHLLEANAVTGGPGGTTSFGMTPIAAGLTQFPSDAANLVLFETFIGGQGPPAPDGTPAIIYPRNNGPPAAVILHKQIQILRSFEGVERYAWTTLSGSDGTVVGNGHDGRSALAQSGLLKHSGGSVDRNPGARHGLWFRMASASDVVELYTGCGPQSALRAVRLTPGHRVLRLYPFGADPVDSNPQDFGFTAGRFYYAEIRWTTTFGVIEYVLRALGPSGWENIDAQTFSVSSDDPICVHVEGPTSVIDTVVHSVCTSC